MGCPCARACVLLHAQVPLRSRQPARCGTSHRPARLLFGRRLLSWLREYGRLDPGPDDHAGCSPHRIRRAHCPQRHTRRAGGGLGDSRGHAGDQQRAARRRIRFGAEQTTETVSADVLFAFAKADLTPRPGPSRPRRWRSCARGTPPGRSWWVGTPITSETPATTRPCRCDGPKRWRGPCSRCCPGSMWPWSPGVTDPATTGQGDQTGRFG
jgi:hypothetical protein